MQQAIELEKLWTFKEAMDYLRVSRATLNRWIADKRIPAHKVGGTWRFYASELRATVLGVKTAEQGEE